MNVASAHCLIILSGKPYMVRPCDGYDGWLAKLCGYSGEEVRETVLLSQMFGTYRYMGWVKGLKKNHSRVLRRLYQEREEHVRHG